MKKALLLLLGVFVLLGLAGCGRWTPVQPDPEYEQFYRGSEGVIMRFVPGSPPPVVFYHANDPSMSRFEVSVEAHNIGASDAIGALYISGFSPDIIEIQRMDIKRQGISDCIFDLTSFTGNGIGFFFSCAVVEGGFHGPSNWDFRINEVGRLLNIDSLEGWNHVGVSDSGLTLGWDNWGSLDFLNHGRALVLAMSSIDFRQYNGFPFNNPTRGADGPGVLRGDNYNFPGGEFAYQDFVADIGRYWPPGLDETRVDFIVTSCYAYATYAAPMVCIDPAPYDQTRKVCMPHEYKWSGSQGAPVAITNLKQDPAGSKYVYFTFTVRNVGTGTIINPGYLERCSPYFPGRFDQRHQDVIYVGDIRIGRDRLVCEPGYEIRLINGVGTFTCRYELEYATAKTAYETPLVVELWYGYQDHIQTSTRIKRVT